MALADAGNDYFVFRADNEETAAAAGTLHSNKRVRALSFSSTLASGRHVATLELLVHRASGPHPIAAAARPSDVYHAAPATLATDVPPRPGGLPPGRLTRVRRWPRHHASGGPVATRRNLDRSLALLDSRFCNRKDCPEEDRRRCCESEKKKNEGWDFRKAFESRRPRRPSTIIRGHLHNSQIKQQTSQGNLGPQLLVTLAFGQLVATPGELHRCFPRRRTSTINSRALPNSQIKRRGCGTSWRRPSADLNQQSQPLDPELRRIISSATTRIEAQPARGRMC